MKTRKPTPICCSGALKCSNSNACQTVKKKKKESKQIRNFWPYKLRSSLQQMTRIVTPKNKLRQHLFRTPEERNRERCRTPSRDGIEELTERGAFALSFSEFNLFSQTEQHTPAIVCIRKSSCLSAAERLAPRKCSQPQFLLLVGHPESRKN